MPGKTPSTFKEAKGPLWDPLPLAHEGVTRIPEVMFVTELWVLRPWENSVLKFQKSSMVLFLMNSHAGGTWLGRPRQSRKPSVLPFFPSCNLRNLGLLALRIS